MNFKLIRLLDSIKALSEVQRAPILLYANLTEGDFQKLYVNAISFLERKQVGL